MSAIAWIGLITAALNEEQLRKILLPLVAFASGSMLGGALLHLLPEAVAAGGPGIGTFLPALAGFALFFLAEQFLAWHRSHAVDAAARHPVTYLILLADGLHNFVGGLAIGASFIVSTDVGIITWMAAAAHELPQEVRGPVGAVDLGVRHVHQSHRGEEMMSSAVIFFIGIFAVLMLGLFVYVTMHEIKVSPPGVRPFRGLLPIDENVPKLETAQRRPLRIVLATDGRHAPIALCRASRCGRGRPTARSKWFLSFTRECRRFPMWSS
jgi:zinc and cadmium transporter